MARNVEDFVRADAKASGASKFFGKLCKKHPGHSERWTSNGTCTLCVAEISTRHWNRNKTKLKLRQKGLPETKELIDKIDNHSGKCDICGGEGDGRYSKLNIDHCHVRKIFRGMLCRKCNTGIGLFSDSPEILFKAIEYLKGS